MAETYSTKDIADSFGIHVNTVRFYEDIGFITKPNRLPNGYRVYTDLQRDQCALVRLAMRAEVLQNGLRKKAVEIVQLCAARDMDAALAAADEYRVMIAREIQRAKAAADYAENRLNARPRTKRRFIKRQEAARVLGVTSETLRTWERSGLINIARGANGYRMYTPEDMERLNIVRTLRAANYSLSSILRLLMKLDSHDVSSVEAVLNTPDADDDIVSVCDRLATSLKNTAADADELLRMLSAIKEKYPTLR